MAGATAYANAWTLREVSNVEIVPLVGPTMEPWAAKVRVSCIWGVRVDSAIYVFTTRAHLSAYLDVNECLIKNGGGDSKSECLNLPGSRKCDDCPAGWVNEGATGCKGLCHALIYLWYCTCEVRMRRATSNDLFPFMYSYARRRIRRERMSEKQWRLRQQAKMHQHGGKQNMWKLPGRVFQWWSHRLQRFASVWNWCLRNRFCARK